MPKPVRIILIVLTVALSAWFMSVYTKGSSPFYGDSLGYYAYLPSTFIYHNLDTIYSVPTDKGIEPGVYSNVRNMNGYPTTPKGYVLNQYTYGVALMELPFFLVGHAYEKITGGYANGYSDTYRCAIHLSSIVYALMGLIFTYLVVKRFVGDRWSFLSVLLLFVGTNLFWFTLRQAGMSHVPVFFLVASLCWLTIKVHDNPRMRYFILIGLVLGMIALIRPTDLLFALIPLLYDVHNDETLKSRLLFLRTHFTKLLMLAAVFCLPLIPQMLYWKWLAGSYIYYSYGDQGFNWTKPRLLSGLFYGNNGWLAYSPIMFFALFGMLLLRSTRPWALLAWIILPVYVYVIYSWYCYNYINGLGSRPMIHVYPLLAIFLAAFLRFIASKGRVVIGAVMLLCLFLCAVNVSYSRQQALGILNSEESNLFYNWSILFRTDNTYKDLVTYDLGEFQPNEKDLVKMPIRICNDYDDSLSEQYVKDGRVPSPYFYLIKADQEFLPNPIKVTYDSKKFKGAKWVKCSGDFLIPDGPNGYYRHLMPISFKQGEGFTKWKAVKIINKLDVWNSKEREVLQINRWVNNKWGHIWFYVRIPDETGDGDVLELNVWNIARQPIYVDNLCLEVYK
ncbi:MAG: hypothetical protein EOP56_10255 [Sphingobacteriales bacterium]|nr:MAG: hypothetical protein EOP56_10255 [Sphingobacteriales bacterium]